MSLTRKMLAAMDIPAEKIDEIISAHTETVSAIKEEKETLKSEVDALKDKVKGLEAVESKLETANEELKKFKDGNWEKKYTDLKSEYDTFKTDTEKKAVETAKSSAYRKILQQAGISEKRIDTVMKVSGAEIDAVELDEKGEAKDADKLTESAKTAWADFIQTKREEGAGLAKPPENTGGDARQPSRAAELVAKYNSEHYGNPKED